MTGAGKGKKIVKVGVVNVVFGSLDVAGIDDSCVEELNLTIWLFVSEGLVVTDRRAFLKQPMSCLVFCLWS
jgi:hypothetical protein